LRNIVPAMYGFFAITFVAFYFGISLLDDRVLIDKAFYLWVSVYALFNVSVFWTFMADTFNPGQAKRLFGIIGAGASAGALFGPAIPTLFAGVLGNDTLMLIASVSLLMVIPLVFYMYHLKATELGNAEFKPTRQLRSLAATGGRGSRPFLRIHFCWVSVPLYCCTYSSVRSSISNRKICWRSFRGLNGPKYSVASIGLSML